MAETGFIRVNKIIKALTTDSSGDASSEVDISGQVVKTVAYAATTGAYVTIKELIDSETVTVSGDTIFERVITASATHLPYVNATDITGSTLSSQYIHPTIGRAVITVASGGNAMGVNTYIYVR